MSFIFIGVFQSADQSADYDKPHHAKFTWCGSYGSLLSATLWTVYRMKCCLTETLERCMHNEAQYFLSLLYGRQGPCEPYLLWLCASHASPLT